MMGNLDFGGLCVDLGEGETTFGSGDALIPGVGLGVAAEEALTAKSSLAAAAVVNIVLTANGTVMEGC